MTSLHDGTLIGYPQNLRGRLKIVTPKRTLISRIPQVLFVSIYKTERGCYKDDPQPGSKESMLGALFSLSKVGYGECKRACRGYQVDMLSHKSFQVAHTELREISNGAWGGLGGLSGGGSVLGFQRG